MSLLKTWKRRILRRFAKQNTDKGVLSKTWKKIATGIAGLGFLATSNLAFGQQSVIQAFDNNSTQIDVDYDNNNIKRFHITSLNTSGTNAFNSFSDFNLVTNETANFYLPNGTTNLINFVKSKIEIGGTVNAIKNNKIGGNLFFLSSQGMVLGSSGVINCGALYAMTPTAEFMDKFVGNDNGALNIAGNAAEIAQITSRKFVNRNDVLLGEGVPLNADGSIVIAGRINAIDNVGAYAGKVTLEGSGRIDTGITDFSALVNTSNIWQQDATGNFYGQPSLEVAVSGLAMTTNNDGNVELVAVADNLGKTSSSSLGSGFTSFTKSEAKAEVTVKGTVNAKRDANFEAVAVNGTLKSIKNIYEYGTTRDLKTFVNTDGISSTEAKVEVTSTARINADKDVAMTATSLNFYKKKLTPRDIGVQIAGMVTPVNVNAEVAVIDSKSSVKVNSGAVVTAKKNINVSASSETDVVVGAGTSIAKALEASSGACAGVVYADTNCEANVEISGTLNAGTTGDTTAGDITLDSSADTILDASAAAKTGNDKSLLATGIVIANVSNKSEIKVNSTATVNARRDVIGSAYSGSDVATDASVESADDTAAAMAVNYTDYNSSAKVDIQKSITAPGNIDFSAINLVTQNTIGASSGIGYSKFSAAVANLQSSLISGLFGMDKLASKFTGPLEELGEKFSAAGAVVFTQGNHNATLNIAKDISLTATKDLVLKSSSVIEDISFSASSGASSGSGESPRISVSAGLLYSDISQNATVQIGDATNANSAALKGKTVTISSEAKIEYNRLSRAINAVLDAIEQLKQEVSGTTQLALLDKLKTAYQTIKSEFTNVNAEGISKSEKLSAFMDALKSVPEMLTAFSGFISGENRVLSQAAKIVTSAADFSSYNNFLNCFVAASASGEDSTENQDVGFSGSAALTSFKAISDVLIGRNVTVQAVSPTVNAAINIDALVDIDMINSAGYLQPTPSSTGAKSIGGTYFRQEFDTSARVMLPEGVKIDAGSKDVSISATNDAKTVTGAFAMSQAGAGLQGMVTHLDGNNDALVYIDNEANIASTKNLKLNALNNTKVINLAGSVMISSSVGVGIGIAINDFVKNSIVFVGDIDTLYQDYIDDKTGTDKSTTTNSILNLTTTKITLSGSMDAQAKSVGGFITAGIAGGITKNDDSGEESPLDKITSKIDMVEDKVAGTINKIADKFSGVSKISEATSKAESGSQTNPKFTLSIAGSAGLNFIENNTKVDVSGITVDLNGTTGSNLNAIAVNNSDVMGFAGAAGIMYQSSTKNTSSVSVGITGAVGLNSIKNNTSAIIKNSAVNKADKLNVYAVNGGSNIAGGLGLQVSKNSSSAAKGAVTLGGSVSVNMIDNNVRAELNQTSVTGDSGANTPKTDVNVAAYESDLQVTGGVQVTVGQQRGAFGAAVNVSDISNNVAAAINGGTFIRVKDVRVQALQALAQISGALTVGVVLGTDNSAAITGAMIYNKLANNLTATINGATITPSGDVTVQSQDYLLGETQTGFGQILNRADSGVSSFIDADGGDYYDVDTSNDVDGTVTALKDQIKKGSLIVSGAMAVSAADVALGAAVVINNIDNNFTARIDNSTINNNTKTVETNAKTDTFLVSAAVGAAVSSKYGAGGGSVVWNDINSAAASGITNSTLTSKIVNAKAGNDSRIIGLAGLVAAGKGTAVGLTLAYNKVTGGSDAFSLGNVITGPGLTTAGSQMLVNAANNGEILGLAVSAAIGSDVGVGGALALNEVTNNSLARIDNKYTDSGGTSRTVASTKAVDFKSLTVKAEDNADIKSLAGGVSVGGTAAVGGAIAWNDIKGSTAASAKNIAITATDVLVQGKNAADIWSLAAGCGGSGNVAVQGAAVSTRIARTVSAALENVNEEQTTSNIDVLAESTGEINSSAAVVAIGANVGVGAGVSVNRIADTVSSSVTGGILNVKNLAVKAKSAQTIRTAGAAGSGGAYAGVSGSVSVNIINNAVSALINGNASVIANDNIGVVAQSDETLLNYAGIVGGGLVGVGVGLSVNDIQGNTSAGIENSTVKAMGNNTGISLNNDISDTAMNDAFIDDTTLNAQYTLAGKRTVSTKKGLVVDSSATHTLKSFVVNAAGGAAAGAGTINVSRITGTTDARISNTRILNGSNSDVSVNAGDYSNLSGFVGSAGLGGTGIGLAADTGIVKRTTSAKLDGIISSSIARDVSVKADAKLGISGVDAGVAVGAGGNAIAGTLATNIMQSNTEAIVNNANLTLKSLSVMAAHKAKTNIAVGALSVGVNGLGGALGVNSVKDTVKAEITGSTITMASNGSGKFEVQALNDVTLNTIGAAISGGVAVAGSGNLAVNLIESDVFAQVKNTTMVNRATEVTVKADDTLTIDADLGTVAVSGVAGAGASIAVNTIDGKSRVVIDSSVLYAMNTMNIIANTTRNLTQLVATIAGGAGAFAGNVVYISAGKVLTTGTEDGESNVRDTVTGAQNNSYGNIGTANGALTTSEINSLNAKPGSLGASTANKSETSVKVFKTGSAFPRLDCNPSGGTGVVNVKARETTNIDVTGGGGTVGALSAGGSVSFIDLQRNVTADVRSAYFYSNTTGLIEALSTGNTKLKMYQGTAGIIGAATAAYGRISTGGTVNANLSSGVQRCGGDLTVQAIDDASANAESYGLTVGGKYAVGVLVTQIDNNSTANVTLTNNDHSSKNFTAEAKKDNDLTAKTVGGAAGLFAAGTGIASTVNDGGGAKLAASSGTYKTTTGKTTLSAVSSPTVVSEAKSAALSGLVSAGVSVAKATLSGVTETKVTNTPTFNTPEVIFKAVNTATSNLLAEGVSGGLAGTFGYNESNAQNNSVVNVLIGDTTYSTINTILSLLGSNSVTQNVETRGLTVSGLIASGNNKAKAEANSSTNVSLDGSTTEKSVKKIDILAKNTTNHDIKADGSGGGLISVDGLSAYAVNTMTGVVNAAIGGKWKLKETLNLFAEQYNTVKISADSLRASLIGYSGTKAENTVNSTTKTSFADDSAVTAEGDITFRAKNVINSNEDGAYSASGAGYGGIVVNGARSIANITSTTEAKVGKGVNLLSNMGEIVGEALTRANIYNKVRTKGAGVVNDPLSFNQSTITFNDKVLTDTTSLLKTVTPGKNIRLAASDNLVAVLTADADMQGGFAGVSKAETTSTVTKNNTVDIYGDINSVNDVNIYTDANAAGETARYDLTATADSVNKSAAASAKAVLNSTTTQNNKINVYSGADIETIRHINLNSNTGNMLMLETASEYTWHSGGTTGGYASTASGELGNNTTTSNKVTINGNLLAGKENKVELTIDGRVDFDGEITNSVTAPTITSTKAEYAAGVTTGTMDYANDLFKRYLAVSELAREYAGTSAGDGFTAEKTRLLAEMQKYGLYDPNTGELVGGLLVQYVSLPDMLCTGGDVVINTGSVAGNGNITAKGAPQILVNNNSNLYMKVNDLAIVEGGGRLIYNSSSLGSAAKNTLKTLSTITVNEADSLISLKENWSGTLNAVIEGETVSMTPITNIELNGNINNAYGKVQINNTSGDIVMQGRTVDSGATINALEVELTAPKGAISQGFTDGIVNIGGNPETIYKATTDTWAATIPTNQKTTTKQTYTFGNLDRNDQEGTWIAGGAVYLNASDINVNGLIQSGFSDYKLTLSSGLDSSLLAKISTYDTYYNGQEITPDMLTAYKLNTGGAKKDTSGNWYYEVQAYYNPQTKSIVLEDIAPQGGRIYLTGRISSTGNGKIRAFDGSANVNLTVGIDVPHTMGKSKIPVTLGSVNLGDEAGLVSITDTGKKVKTDYTRTTTTVTEYDRYTLEQNVVKTSRGYKMSWIRVPLPDIVTVSGSSTTYQPATGLYYNWTTGQKISGTNKWAKDVKFRVWGAYTKTQNQLQLEEQNSDNLVFSGSTNNPRESGIFIGAVTGSSANYFIKYTKNVNSYSEFFEQWKTFDNAIHSKGTEHYLWGNTQDSSITYQHALKADNNISISFIGSTTGGSLLLSNSGSVNLSSSVIGKAGSALNFAAGKGSIEQTGGQLVADTFNFSATSGIGSNNTINCKVVSDTGYLHAVTTAGNINIAASNTSGKYGDIKIKKVTTTGNVMLDVYGSIYNNSTSSTDSLLQGRRIDLISRNGQIGKAGGGWLFINGGQTTGMLGAKEILNNDTMSASVNAKAKSNVCLMQVNGDMRLGYIESTSASVDLKVANGSFDNALPVNATTEKRSSDELIDKWLELGLFNSNGTSNGATVKQTAVDNYKNAIKAEYASYAAQKAYYTATKATKTTAYTALDTKYKSYATADAYLSAQAAVTTSDYYKILNGTYGWTQDQLLYALQSSIMNRTTGSTDSYNRDANIIGKNITLSAPNGGIGKNASAETVSIKNLGSNLDTLKKLAATEADDIIWNEANGTATINKTTAIGIKMLSSTNYLNATARDNVYIAAATNDPIYVKSINSGANNIRLLGKKGIFNYNSDNTINFTGKDLLIEGGTSSIGTADRAVVTNLNGKMTARADGLINLYQYSNNPLVISALYGGSDVKLRAMKDLRSVNTGDAFDDSGYINSLGDLTLVSDSGSIGEVGKGLRILIDNQKPVKAAATGGNVYLKGVTNATGKNLKISELKAATANGSAGIDSAGGIELAGSVDIVTLALKTATAFTQSAANTIKATLLEVVANGAITLDNVNNQISRAALSGAGNILLKNKSALVLNNIQTLEGYGLTINNTNTITLNGEVRADSVNITATNAARTAGSIVTGQLTLTTANGADLGSENRINQATFNNTSSGDISFGNRVALTLGAVTNSSTGTTSSFKADCGNNAINLTGNINAVNVDIKGETVAQAEKTSNITTDNLKVTTSKGMSLDSTGNKIVAANLTNTGSGDIELKNGKVMTISASNGASGAKINIDNSTTLTVDNITCSNVELRGTSIAQTVNGKITTENLTVNANYGIALNSFANSIAKAALSSTSINDVILANNRSTLTLLDCFNGSTANASSKIDVSNTGNLIISGSQQANNIKLTSSGASVTQSNSATGNITTNNLTVNAATGITIDRATNAIAKAGLSNTGEGAVLFKQNAAVNLATVQNKATAMQETKIESGGTIKLESAMTAQNIVISASSVSQTAKITTDKLKVTANGAITLDKTDNEIKYADLTNNTGNIILKNKNNLAVFALNNSSSASDKIDITTSGILHLGLSGRNATLNADSINQHSMITVNDLTATAKNGIMLNGANNIQRVNLSNSDSGNVELNNEGNLTITGLNNGNPGSTAVTKIIQNGVYDSRLVLSGNLSGKNIDIEAMAISQNSGNIKTDSLKLSSKNGISLGSLDNEILTVSSKNDSGDMIFKNKSNVTFTSIKSGGNLTIGNNGNITVAPAATSPRSVRGRIYNPFNPVIVATLMEARNNITVNLIGDFTASDCKVSAGDNLNINATGRITATSVQGRNIALNSSVRQGDLSLNIFDMANMNLRLQIDGDQTNANTRGAVNQIAAAGGIDVHDLLAEENVYGLTEGGDIMVANLGGKRVTLIINNDQGNVGVEQAQLGESMNVTTSGAFKGGLIEHTGDDDSLKLAFSGVNGQYMNDVTVDRVTSARGVHVSNLDSLTARINADTDVLQLSSVDLLGMGTFSNGKTSVVVPGSDNTSLEITLAGATSGVTRRVKQHSEQSMTDKIAGIVSSTSDGMESGGRTVKPTDCTAQENLIESAGSDDADAVPVMIAARDGRIYLTSADNENEDDGGVTAESDDENSETEANK